MAGDPTITIVGNLTSDPDLRYVGSVSYTHLTLTTKRIV